MFRRISFGAALSLAALAISISLAANASDGATASAKSDLVATYTLDSSHTQVMFAVDRFGFDRVWGRFDGITGELVLDEAHPERSSVKAVIPIASLDTGNGERDGFLRGEFWLKGNLFPSMEFQSTQVRQTSPTQATVIGNLTLAGTTAPVTLEVTFNKGGRDPVTRRQAVGFSATGSLKRAAFGVRTAPTIGNEVRFHIEALAMTGEPAPAPAPAPKPRP